MHVGMHECMHFHNLKNSFQLMKYFAFWFPTRLHNFTVHRIFLFISSRCPFKLKDTQCQVYVVKWWKEMFTNLKTVCEEAGAWIWKLITDLHFDFSVSAGISSRRKYVPRKYIHYCGYFILFIYLVCFDLSSNLICNWQIITILEIWAQVLLSHVIVFPPFLLSPLRWVHTCNVTAYRNTIS